MEARGKADGDFTRTYPSRPILGVGAVVIHEGRVLLVKRGEPPARGRWSIPGGAVKLGETLREAVIRELKEECSVLVEPREVVGVFDVIHEDKKGAIRYHYVLVDLRADYVGGSLKPMDDASDARWVPLDDLDSMDVLEMSKRLIIEVSRGGSFLGSP